MIKATLEKKEDFNTKFHNTAEKFLKQKQYKSAIAPLKRI